MKKYVYINGKFVNSDEAKVSFKDGGFQKEMEYLKQSDLKEKII